MERNVLQCPSCYKNFDTHLRSPLTLECQHPICKFCLQIQIENKQNSCPCCHVDVNISKKEIHEYEPHMETLEILNKEQPVTYNAEERQDETDERQEEEFDYSPEFTEKCFKHPQKVVEYFCEKCNQAVCVTCIYIKHNGHKLIELEEKSNVIKENLKDFEKMVQNLMKVNDDNKFKIEKVTRELDDHKERQVNLTVKAFNTIIEKVLEKKKEILEEFSNKYAKQEKEFKNLKELNNYNTEETFKIRDATEIIEDKAESYNDAVLLNNIDYYSTFLYKCFLDIKRLYKAGISIDAELKIDPIYKEREIIIKDLIYLIDKLDSKLICYPENLQEIEDNDLENEKVRKLMRNKHEKNVPRAFMNLPSKEQVEADDAANKNPGLRVASAVSKRSKQINQQSSRQQMQEMRRNLANVTNNLENLHKNVDELKSFKKPKEQPGKNFPVVANSSDNEDKNNNPNLPAVNRIQKQAQRQIKSAQIGGDKITVLPQVKSSGKENLAQLNAIYCISETNYMLKYFLDDSYWQYIELDERKKYEFSFFPCNYRWASLTGIPGYSFIYTGGASNRNDEASNLCYEISATSTIIVSRQEPMLHPRYSHCSLYVNGQVFVIGGYDHRDKEGVSTSTLKSCEAFSIKDRKWSRKAAMNQARALFSAMMVDANSIFVFGGIYNTKVLSSIEKYDVICDSWTTYFAKLPEKLAKMGTVKIKDDIVILGGVDSNLNVVRDVRVFSQKSQGWKKLPKMLYPREFRQSAFLYGNYIYAIGGNSYFNCEKYDIAHRSWKVIESYSQILDHLKVSEMYKFSLAMNYLETL